MKQKFIKLFLIFSTAIISYSFFNVNEAHADFQPGEPIYVDADNISGIEDGSIENPYNTIQEAVDAAINNGDNAIFVNDGTYNENIFINKSRLSILSMNGAEATIIQALDYREGLFEIWRADYVKINGFTVKGAFSSSMGISLNNANFCKISNNIVLHNFSGIVISSSGNNTLINNKMFDNDFNFSVFGNSDSHYDNDIDISNTVDGRPIYYIQNANNQTYDSSTNAGTFYCISCNNITAKDLTLTKNDSGIFFWKTENSKIENIITLENISGISLRFSDNNTLVDSTISENMTGIRFYYSDNNILTGNTISENLDGISFFKFENNKIYHNNFINNKTNSEVKYSTDNSFDNGYPSGGNYWSDYTGVDLYKGPDHDQSGKDGIGDVPYTFEDSHTHEESNDRYPLMEESGWENPVDNTSPKISEIFIEPNKVKANQTLIIKAKITDESKIVSVKAILSHLGQVFLSDDGENPDETAGDGIYANNWTIPEGTNLGEYTLAIIAEDEFGNEGIDNSESFEVVSPYPPPEKYAPNLWFDSEESYYPINPFFYVDETNDIDDIDEISGEASKNNYIALSEEDKKKNKFTVFYHVDETEDKTQWVYEYFFYYAYNNFRNEHYHDWEGIFVFVDKATEKVERVIASAHGKWANNNEYFNPNFRLGERVGIMVEEGSHANCTDRNNDGLFQGNDITNGPLPFAWGIRNRNINDKKHGYQIQPEIYNPNLIEINNDFIDKFKNYKSFPNSPILGIGCFNVPIFGGRKCVLGVGGKPAEHPWINEAYDNPEKIIPKFNNYINGTINPLFIPGMSNPTTGIILIMSEEPYPFTFTNEKGDFLINNIEPGEHNIIVNLEGYSPYKQRFIVKENGNGENEIIAGVNGILNLIPESESFRFEGIAKDEKENLIINAVVDVYDENNQKLFTTLTDKNGQYLFNLSSKNNHTIKIIQEDKIGEIENISANSGETIIEETTVSNPKSLKENTLSELKEIEIKNQRINNQINKIEKLIEESLNEQFWIDNWHLKEKDYIGLKVFQKEFKAVKRIEKILKYSESKCRKNKCKDLEFILPTLDNIANNLSQSDYLLAEKLIQETKNDLNNLEKEVSSENNKAKKKIKKKVLKTFKKNLKKAENYSKKAKKQKSKKNYSKSIYYSMRSWNLSKQTKSFLNLIKKGE